MQAAENEEKRKKAAERLRAAYDTNVSLLERKRSEYHKRERANAERRAKQAEERDAADARKKEEAAAKAEKRKVRFRVLAPQSALLVACSICTRPRTMRCSLRSCGVRYLRHVSVRVP